MKVRHRQPARFGLFILAAIWMLVVLPVTAMAAPYAAMVMDARTGEVLHSHNADTRLHPASLTKMMTLYIAFQAVERGEISLDTLVTVSAKAAAEPPSKLGLKAGQKIKLRYLIRASAVKSANDAATTIGEAISGSEAAFARRMNRTAKAMGMTRTTFKVMHGLTTPGHLSTARDMTILGRHMIYDYPEYYNLFSRVSTNVGGQTVYNTNRRLLGSYKGADGIKTGYTRAAGFNLVASAERGRERVIATVFGGRSSASRNAKVAELLDLGFRRAPSRTKTIKPDVPAAQLVARAEPSNAAPTTPGSRTAGKTIRLTGAVKKSLRPRIRPMAEPEPVVVAALQDGIADALKEVQSTPAPVPDPAPAVTTAAIAPPKAAPTARIAPATIAASITPKARPRNLVLASTQRQVTKPRPVEQQVVTRVSTSGGRHWGINVGRYPSRYKDERVLLKTALNEMATLDGSLRRIVQRKTGFDANFMGLSRETADLACRRLQARKVTCFMIGPS